MRSIEVSSQFKRDAKKNYLSLLTPAWGEVLNCLTNVTICRYQLSTKIMR